MDDQDRCTVCGWPVTLHFDDRNRKRDCAFAARAWFRTIQWRARTLKRQLRQARGTWAYDAHQ